ncbi:MAG: deoxyribonuclease IV [Thermoplasmata archaeon]
MILGAHIGIAEGLAAAPETAREIGCGTLQIFSKSPQMWKGPPIAPEAAAAFRQAVTTAGLRWPAVHQSYLPNLASPKPPTLTQSRAAFLDELGRAESVGAAYLIFHPGAHLGSGPEAGIRTLAESLNVTFNQSRGYHVRALVECMAGQGTTLASSFEEIAQILAQVNARDRVGVALDTCHLFAAGYDFRTALGYRTMMESLEATVGSKNIFAFHLNDAKGDLGSHLDRHENIGVGSIGREGFHSFLVDPTWKETPGYLETPLGEDGYGQYARDLVTLRSIESGSTPPRASRSSSPASRPRPKAAPPRKPARSRPAKGTRRRSRPNG